MFVMSIRFFVVSLLVHSISALEDDTIDESPLDEEYLPLILIKSSKDRMQLPDRVTKVVKKGWLSKSKEIRFTGDSVFEERFYCPSEQNGKQRQKLEDGIKMDEQDGNPSRDKIDENCLLKKTKPKGAAVPSCARQPHPKIMKMLTTDQMSLAMAKYVQPIYKQMSCGSENKGRAFQFGYQICKEFSSKLNIQSILPARFRRPPFKNISSVHMYEFCYDDSDNEIMFTIHAIVAPILLFQNYLSIERAKPWAMENYNTAHMPRMKFENVESTFQKIQELSSNPFKIQLLVPPEDFPFLAWRIPVYHYANANLIHEDLQSCWKNIHDMIRQHATTKPLDIFQFYTGAFKLSEKKLIKVIKEVEIPDVWVKVVHNSPSKGKTSGVAIIANNYRDEQVNELITETYKCKRNLCTDFINEKFSSISDDIRCCALSEEIEELFGHELKFTRVLLIDDLIVTLGEK